MGEGRGGRHSSAHNTFQKQDTHCAKREFTQFEKPARAPYLMYIGVLAKMSLRKNVKFPLQNHHCALKRGKYLFSESEQTGEEQ